jgi:membrane protein DedA with SNARE-associated domain
METLFLHYLVSAAWLIYILIFIGLILEGDAVLFAAFYVAHQGYLKLEILIPVVFAGALISDILWYKFGSFLEKKSAFVKKQAEKISRPIDRHLRKRPLSTIFISQFVFGLYHATLMRAGAIKVKFWSYLKTVFFSSVVWISLIGGLAYFSSLSIILLKKYVKYGEVGLLIGFIILFAIGHIISRFGKQELED